MLSFDITIVLLLLLIQWTYPGNSEGKTRSPYISFNDEQRLPLLLTDDQQIGMFKYTTRFHSKTNTSCFFFVNESLNDNTKAILNMIHKFNLYLVTCKAVRILQNLFFTVTYNLKHIVDVFTYTKSLTKMNVNRLKDLNIDYWTAEKFCPPQQDTTNSTWNDAAK